MAVLFNHRFRGGVSSAGPASYATGGFSLDLTTELPHTSSPVAAQVETDSTTYGARYDLANSKVVAIVRATGAEVNSTTDLSSVTFYVTGDFAK